MTTHKSIQARAEAQTCGLPLLPVILIGRTMRCKPIKARLNRVRDEYGQ
jgi:hypothetical protein